MLPEDLIKYGLIPEFVGRLPVVATLEELDEEALVRILHEPKNSLIRQYQTILEFEGVELKFTDEALVAIAREALKRNVGARGLRIILEELMLDLMYTIPSQRDIKQMPHQRGGRGEPDAADHAVQEGRLSSTGCRATRHGCIIHHHKKRETCPSSRCGTWWCSRT